MFLTLDVWLSHFPPLHLSKEEFTKRLVITYVSPQTLHEIISLAPKSSGRPLLATSDKRYTNRTLIVDVFYSIIIENRQDYLSQFFNNYLSILHTDWTPLNIKNDGIINSAKRDKSKQIIRNLFYLELLRDTIITNSVKSECSFMKTLTLIFNDLVLVDRLFAPSSIDLILRAPRNFFYLIQSYQPKASILNPFTIKFLLDEYPGKSLFTPVLSWGAYLLAFEHSAYSEYVGVDVMESVCDKVKLLASNTKSVSIINSQSELMPPEFTTKYVSHFDLIIVCPPYFDMEIYSEGHQSTSEYPSYAEWLQKYWRPTVALCRTVINEGGIFIVIVNNYQSLRGHYYDLQHDLHKITADYFHLFEICPLTNRKSSLRITKRDRGESAFFYRRKCLKQRSISK